MLKKYPFKITETLIALTNTNLYYIYSDAYTNILNIFFYSDDTTRIKNDRGKTRGKGLKKLKRTLGKKMVIEIPLGKGRPVKAAQSSKLSN